MSETHIKCIESTDDSIVGPFGYGYTFFKSDVLSIHFQYRLTGIVGGGSDHGDTGKPALKKNEDNTLLNRSTATSLSKGIHKLIL